VTVISPTRDILAVGTTTNEVHLLHYPALVRAAPVIAVTAGELFDISFTATTVAIASSTNIFIYNLHEERAPTENMSKAGSFAGLDEGAQGKRNGNGRGKGRGKGKSNGNQQGPALAQLESLELAGTIVRPKLAGVGAGNSTFRAVR